MIQVRNLTKKYGEFLAIDNISFDIERGKIYGFLGPNGAGKSTTMNIITGCLAATGGSVTIDGKDIFHQPIEAKRHIGYLPEFPPLYSEMTPVEYLSFVAEAKGLPYEEATRQVREVMELTAISDVSERLIRNLSKGYRQRVGIAQAMLGNPDVIILDEPTVGLDPKQITEIRELIRKLGKTKTVIVSSHILAEISATCDHVIIISRGKVVANDTLQMLEESALADCRLFLGVRGECDELLSLLSSLPGIEDCRVETASNEQNICRISLAFQPKSDPRDAIFYALAEKKMPLVEMNLRHATLEDIFLKLTAEESFEEESMTETASEEAEKESEGIYIPQFNEQNKEDES